MDNPLPKEISTGYTINNLVALSAKLKSLHDRLVTTITILNHIKNSETPSLHYQWIFDISNFDLRETDDYIHLSDEMRETLRIFQSHSVEEEYKSEKYSQDDERQLMATIAFMICFGSNPYLGKGFYKKIIISKEWETRYWGIDRIFSYSRSKDNSPDGYYQSRTIDLWESKNNSDLRSLLERYFDEDDKSAADDILQTAYGMLSKVSIQSETGSKFYLNDVRLNTYYRLYDGKILMTPDYRIIGKASLITGNGKTELYLKNLSNSAWELTTASGKKKDILPKEIMPVRSGMRIVLPKDDIIWEVNNL